MVIAFAILLGAALAGLLVWAHRTFRTEEDPLVAEINALLPQTQCAQCGYPGCKPYAEALAKDEAAINLCPPGGEKTMRALAELLHKEPIALEKTQEAAKVALIDEARCIGCLLCIKACPVDAIIGAAKQMHTVIPQECTGCNLCIAPCPVDCIDMVEANESLYARFQKIPTSEASATANALSVAG